MEILDYIDMHFLLGLTLILGVFCFFYYSAARKQTEAMVKLDSLLKNLENMNHNMGSLLHEQRSCNRLLAPDGTSGYPRLLTQGTQGSYAASRSQSVRLTAPLDSIEENPANNKLYVGNIDYSATESELENHFAQYGQIEFVNIPINRYNGRARGFGFVTFTSQQDAERAMALDGSDFKGRPIQVNFAKERDLV